jgi:hypothetical protein
LRRFGVWAAGEAESIDVVGEVVSKNVGGGVQVVDIARGRSSGSKGEHDGEEKGLSLSLIGKVKVRGVGDRMERVGGCSPSVITSSAVGYRG